LAEWRKFVLELERIHAGYGSVRVLEDVSLQVREGEIVGLVGSNGAGKSSLVKVILNLLKPTSGTTKFEGRDITNRPPHKRAEMGIGCVPEGRRLFSKMSVEDNLMVGGINGRARAIRPAAMEEVFSKFPILRERRRQLARTLSGGEQQMLAIGRALMTQPRMIIFDEPSLGLAPKVVREVLDTIRSLNTSRNLTVLLIEQNVAASLEISSRAYVLENGRVVLSGDARNVLRDEHVKRAYLGM
jgi:branched-chain amino acid transport system ATP-binding protein